MRLARYLMLVAGLVVLLAVVHARAVRGAGHDAMSGHMTMTELRPLQPGDKERSDAIVMAARKFADGYTDYRKALADGYTIFHPEIKQNVYHFTNNAAVIQTTLRFDAARPTSLLYEKTAGGNPEYKLVGVMYTAPYRVSEDELNRRVPLSIARWHLHTNLCLPPAGGRADILGPDAKFGLQGSVVTAQACEAAGGTFLPHIFGWMVHVYPYEKDPAKIWAAGMDDDHGMQHDNMPAGMDMPM
jgi:hypothetical protein